MTVKNALRNLEKFGTVLEVTEKERGIYAYTKYLEILNEGTDPIN